MSTVTNHRRINRTASGEINRKAVISFILGLLSILLSLIALIGLPVAVIGLLIGGVSLLEIRGSNQGGKYLAIGGIIFCILSIILPMILIILAYLSYMSPT
ncbi:hypothetical protein [Evansella tamaricis]|uniref:DUF4190 domain-containing protein n=1 Tax=Evansella tamaricis TaxID=2069301 RepID=A0ABS6J9E7_9BACI|nr:hypothetical protein [Evansella tamaricis]MBU9710311.1 hypothetical protein [Evansella tamaricis]